MFEQPQPPGAFSLGRLFRRRGPNRFGLIAGSAILLFYVLLAVLGPRIAPYGINDQDLLGALTPPSHEHILGTDTLGRDLASRLIIGTQYTLTASVVSVAIASVFGIFIGIVAGYASGAVAAAFSALIDLLLTIPSLILAIVIASVVTSGLGGLILATTITFIPPMARLVRGRTLEIKVEDYVLAARSMGASNLRIMFRHILPNATTVIMVEASLAAGQAVLLATALGFIGLGVPPPVPEWGTMLGEGREYLDSAPHLIFCPALAISLLILGFNLFGDGIGDRLDIRSE
jgi:ABC-type dipeptide/oligopeptide/nickel transport system permease subunit